MSNSEGSAPSSNPMMRAWDGYVWALSSLVSFTATKFGHMGAFTVRRPWLVLAVSLLGALATMAGFARFKLENDSNVLWVPQVSKGHDDKQYVQANYPQGRQGASFYAQLQPSQYSAFGGSSVLQYQCTWEMFQLFNQVSAMTVQYQGQALNYSAVCLRTEDGTCDNKHGYLWFWGKSFPAFVAAIQGSATDPSVGNATAFSQQVSKTTFPDGTGVPLLSLFGGTTYAFNPFKLASAQVIAIDFFMDNAVPDDLAMLWHDAFMDMMVAQAPNFKYITYTYITGSSVGEELGKAITGDMRLIIISLLVFIAIAIVFLSKPDWVKTRTSLAFLAIFVTCVGIVSGWGWGLIFGMPFTALQELSPFILLGMGIDVMFILVKSYDIIIQREPGLTLEEAFTKLMSTAGVSVFVTLMASSVAFALGAVDGLNSVKWFSAFATLNTLMVLVLMVTLFISFMVLTEKRIRAGRADCICCCDSDSPEPPQVVGSIPVALPAGSAAAAYPQQPAMQRSASRVVHDDDVPDENSVKRFFRLYYAPLLTRWWFKILVILFFSALCILSGLSINHIKYGQPLSDLAPDGSYLQSYDSVQKATFGQQVGDDANLYFRGFDQSTPDAQYRMLRAFDLVLQDSDFFNASTTAFSNSWLIRFLLWAQTQGATVAQTTNNCYNPLVGKIQGQLASVIVPQPITGCVPQAQFYSLLSKWSNGGEISGVVMKNGVIVTSSISVLQNPERDNDRFSSQLIQNVRDLETSINNALFSDSNNAYGSYTFFIYGSNYIFNEGDEMLPSLTLDYFMLALSGIFVVTLFMLINPMAALLMVIGVGMTGLLLFGELFALKIRFNQVSVINMIMATGLAVDYNIYFAQKFMSVKADGTGNGRLLVAMSDTGAAVFTGGITALIGSVPMAFSKSIIIRTFFKLIFGTILISLFVGLMLIPILLSLIRPPPIHTVLTLGAEPTARKSNSNDSSGSADAEIGLAVTVVGQAKQ